LGYDVETPDDESSFEQDLELVPATAFGF